MKEIAQAFVKAKREFGPALKTSVNPHLKSKYADLGACLEAVEDALLNNGIALMQETSEDATGVTVETVFLHESGEILRCGKLHVPAAKQDPQGYGSALTYARRYSLMTACGIAQEDDDGHAAIKRQQDVIAILRSISASVTVELLKTNYEKAMQMLESAHHPAVAKAKTARYRELMAKETEPKGTTETHPG
jgi:hypothetical protein